MGVVSVVVVCFGLEKVTNVLGFVGTLIIVILIGVGIYCFCTADSGVMQAQQNVQQYVDAGVIMRANFLGIENPILAVTSLIGAYITRAFRQRLHPAAAAAPQGGFGERRLSQRCCSAWACAWCSSPSSSTWIISLQTGAQIPMLAAIQNMLPALARRFLS